MKTEQPDHRKIYTDIIFMKHPEKLDACKAILQKKTFTTLDVIKINQLIFGVDKEDYSGSSQKYKAYDQNAIVEILEFQKKSGYNNMQTAKQFKISRNTLAKWKKMFQI